MIGVISSVCCQIECYGESFLSGCEITAIKCVRFFSSGKTGILADSPWTHSIHTAVRSSQEWRNTGYIIQVFHAFQIGLCINRFYRNQFRCNPFVFRITRDASFPVLGKSIGCDIYIFEIRSHNFTIFLIRFITVNESIVWH